MLLLLSVFVSAVAFSHAYLSLNYYSEEAAKIIGGAELSFHETPTAEHIADIYLRIGGLNPILREDKVQLPSLGLFSSAQKPIILEVIGGILPPIVQKLIGGSVDGYSSPDPRAESVGKILNQYDIKPEIFVIDNEISNGKADVSEWLKKQTRPVFIIHHENSVRPEYHRLLSSNSTAYAPLNERQISQYQICLWTGLGIVLLLLASVCSIAQMEVVPDSLLYAKFQSGRTSGKFD